MAQQLKELATTLEDIMSSFIIYLFIYSIIHVCSKCIKQKYSMLSIYNCHHKHSVTRLHESEKELTTVQCI